MLISGLKYLTGFVSEREEASLFVAIDKEPWLADLRRRVQHYGYRYDYKSRKVDPSMYLGALPPWSQPLTDRLMAAGYLETNPDQLIVNEYEPGQGITAHVDCVPCFGPVVCSITLGSACMMELSAVADPATELLFLERGSLLVLADEARYKWRHAIPGRKSDRVDGQVIRRGRRVSLTFRTVIVEPSQDSTQHIPNPPNRMD
jgi:alkylated DNA repair dioxygenase AlkB